MKRSARIIGKGLWTYICVIHDPGAPFTDDVFGGMLLPEDREWQPTPSDAERADTLGTEERQDQRTDEEHLRGPSS